LRNLIDKNLIPQRYIKPRTAIVRGFVIIRRNGILFKDDKPFYIIGVACLKHVNREKEKSGGHNISSGTYFVRLKNDEQELVRKITVLK